MYWQIFAQQQQKRASFSSGPVFRGRELASRKKAQKTQNYNWERAYSSTLIPDFLPFCAFCAFLQPTTALYYLRALGETIAVLLRSTVMPKDWNQGKRSRPMALLSTATLSSAVYVEITSGAASLRLAWK